MLDLGTTDGGVLVLGAKSHEFIIDHPLSYGIVADCEGWAWARPQFTAHERYRQIQRGDSGASWFGTYSLNGDGLQLTDEIPEHLTRWADLDDPSELVTIDEMPGELLLLGVKEHPKRSPLPVTRRPRRLWSKTHLVEWAEIEHRFIEWCRTESSLADRPWFNLADPAQRRELLDEWPERMKAAA